MTDFEKSLEFVLAIEGGFTNDVNDRGGATNWGITINEISKFLGRKATVDDVKNFPLESAKQIYKVHYWDRMNLDLIANETLKTILFDQGVNRGTSTAIVALQRVLGTKQDGVIGKDTLAKINSKTSKDLIIDYIKDAQSSYIRIVKNNPTQIVFLQGWLNRTHRLLDLLKYELS